MKNKSFFLVFAILLLLGQNLFSQSNSSKTDDFARIRIAAYVPDQVDDFPPAASNMLLDKLNQIVASNGMGGNAQNERFIITANVGVLTKDLTPTAPAMIVLTLSITFYIGDGIDGIKFSSTNLTLKGIGETELKAYITALRSINVSNAEIKSFVQNGKNKIVEYYNSKCDFFLKNAESLSGTGRYEEAIFGLTQIPEVSKECYMKAMDAALVIYQKYIDIQCQNELKSAKAVWASGQDVNAARQVEEIIQRINPASSCYGEVQKFIEVVSKRVLQLDQREWNFKLKVQQDQVDIEKASIRAARDIGVAYGTNQKPVVYNIRTWW